MGESRTELLAWVNDLCQVNFTKIEQCGTGAVQCAIMDSIFRDVPLSKVKFGAKQEYEYVNNFKVLQATFDRHKIDNAIPVERLMKCKMQDNLEFLQWMKKYWDQYYPGGNYDALARRGSSASARAAAAAQKSMTPLKKAVSMNSTRGTTAAALIAPAAMGSAGNTGASKSASAAEIQKKMMEMSAQAEELKVTVDQVEKERDFYFSKLREIEMYVSNQLEGGEGLPNKDALTHIQTIMYKTEEGFEPPTAVDEGETF